MTRFVALLAPALLAGSIGVGLQAGRPGPTPAPARPSAAATAGALSEHYTALQSAADSVVAAQSADDLAPSELAQVTARNLAVRIHAISQDYETLSIAMTAAEYERGTSLWMRLALAQAALETLEQDAVRLGDDSATGPADVRNLADQLSGVLELGRVTGTAAARMFGPQAHAPQAAPTGPIASPRPSSAL